MLSVWRRDNVRPDGVTMFGRVIVLAAVVVALALLGSSFLLNRLPAPVPVSAVDDAIGRIGIRSLPGRLHARPLHKTLRCV